MDIENVLKSSAYLEFINNLDNLNYELLYSQDGYCTLNSKEAIIEAQKVLDKYNSKVESLIKDYEIENAQEIIQDKKTELTDAIKKHYEKQTVIWADEVFQNLIDNCLLSASIEKDNKDKLDKLYNRGLCAISWIAHIKNLQPKHQSILTANFKKDFNNALNSTDSDFLPNNYAQKTNEKTYLELREIILDKKEKFAQMNLSEYIPFLSSYDMLYFKKIQNDLLTFKKTSVIDEINLINSAVEVLKLEKDEQKYEFIKQVLDDFNAFISNNKIIEENNKIELTKRRMHLFFTDKKSDYYKKILIS